MDKLFYYEGNYHKSFGSDGIYGILSIEERENPVTAEELEAERKANWSTSLPYSPIETLAEARKAYDELEERYCSDMHRLSKPLEEYLIAGETPPVPATPAQELLQKYVNNGDIMLITSEL